MAEDEVEGMNDPAPFESAPPAVCCAASDAATAGECALCKRPICKNCRRLVNQKLACGDCLKQILAEIEAEKVNGSGLLFAVGGGVVAAVLCGAAWTAMVILTNMEIGYAAVGVGLATGYGVLLGAGKKKGFNLQVVAVLCAVLGLILGKYFTVAHVILHQVKEAEGLSYFDQRLFPIFVEVLPQLLSPFDALWAFIALRIAWRIPRPTEVRVARASAPA
jgi:hypothetical protein